MDRQKRYHFHGHSAVSSQSQIARNILNVTLRTIRPNPKLGEEQKVRRTCINPAHPFALAYRRRFGGVWCGAKCCQYAIVAITNAVSCQFSAQPSLETEK